MTTVFVLEAGRYEEHHVVGMYTTRERAKLVKTWYVTLIDHIFDQRDVKIVERQLDECVSELRAGMQRYSVTYFNREHPTGEGVLVEVSNLLDCSEMHFKYCDEYYVWARNEVQARAQAALMHEEYLKAKETGVEGAG